MIRASAGFVKLLKLPVFIGGSETSLLEPFHHLANQVCFGFTQEEYSNIIVSIAENDTETEHLIKDRINGIEEIDVFDLSEFKYTLMGNKSLWPAR